MACLATLAPLGRSCSPQMGGLRYIYLLSAVATNGAVLLARFAGEEDWILRTVHADGKDDAYFGLYVSGLTTAALLLDYITTDGYPSPGDLSAPIVRIDVTRQGAQMTSEAQKSKENGTLFYKNSATIPTQGLLPETVDLVQQMAKGGCIVIGETYDGRFQAFGFQELAEIESAAITTGAAHGDNPGATIVLSSEEKTPLLADLAVSDDEGVLVEANSADLTEVFHLLVTT